jgi:hypothetical protein
MPVKRRVHYPKKHKGNEKDKRNQPVFEKIFDKSVKHDSRFMLNI